MLPEYLHANYSDFYYNNNNVEQHYYLKYKMFYSLADKVP